LLLLHDITVPAIVKPRPDGHAQFGMITERDAAILNKMGTGNNVPGNIFTLDGQPPRFPSASDHFPEKQTNVVPIHESMGAYNSMQQSDVHSIGNSTIWAQIGFARFMNYHSRVASRTISDSLPTPSRMAKSASCSRSQIDAVEEFVRERDRDIGPGVAREFEQREQEIVEQLGGVVGVLRWLHRPRLRRGHLSYRRWRDEGRIALLLRRHGQARIAVLGHRHGHQIGERPDTLGAGHGLEAGEPGFERL
jgi:hypothetical protein